MTSVVLMGAFSIVRMMVWAWDPKQVVSKKMSS